MEEVREIRDVHFWTSEFRLLCTSVLDVLHF